MIKHFVFALIVLVVIVSGCTQQPQDGFFDANRPNQSGQPGQPGGGTPCHGCDGVCDTFEQTHPESMCYKADCLGICEEPEPPPGEGGQPPGGGQSGSPSNEITVEATGASYKSVEVKPTGWFTTGQDADIMLSGFGFNNAGGPLNFNHPGGVATDGTHLILADRFNNRVLIWNSLPAGNEEPDIVLGQKNLITNNPGTGLDGLNWPVAVATGGGKLVVADTYNDRLLIWNTFPTQNNEAADISIFLPDSFGTPRTIGSDGKHLVVGDHNAKVGGKDGQGNFFWKSFPTKDDQSYDFFISNIETTSQPSDTAFAGTGIQIGEIFWGPTFTPDGKLMAVGNQLYIWNTFPVDENDMPDLSVGASNVEATNGYHFVGGDGSGLAIAGNRIFISLYNGNKVVAYNSFPASIEKLPDFAIGAQDIDTNTLDNMNFLTNPAAATDGNSLFITSDFDRKMFVWKKLPDESSAEPDYIYKLPLAAWDNELFEGRLILAGKDGVYIWNSLPLNMELPDVRLEGSIGSVDLEELRGVAIDKKYFYLSDKNKNKIYVWEGIPDKDDEPRFSIDVEGPTRLSSDGTYLVVTATEATTGKRILFYEVNGLSSTSQPILLKGVNVNLPQSALAYDGHLLIGDTGFNRVLVWNSISDAVNGKAPDIVLGEEDLDDTTPEIGKDRLFWPASLAFDGSYLWVGEFKFSGRIVRFPVH